MSVVPSNPYSVIPSRQPSRQRIGLVSTYPPKICGLATFAAALEADLVLAGHRVDVVRIDDGGDPASIERPVAAELVNGKPASIRRAAGVLSRCDVAVIQHEYGIYGGADGEEVVDLMKAIDVPIIVVLHTVPLRPTPHQRSLLATIARMADRVVVMTRTAHDRLVASYPIDRSKLVTIPHGAANATAAQRAAVADVAERPQLLTWGLLGPGKGVEHVIDALALLGDLARRPRYTVAGVTHPKVFARDGDAYRRALMTRAWAGGVAASVRFDDTYRDLPALTGYVASASVVVLPYDSKDQVTSGVLVDAIAAGRPVIATAFPHAVEMLSTGAGIVVPHGDPQTMSDAIRSVVTDSDRLESMAVEARRIAPSLSWSSVAAEYALLAEGLVQTRQPVAM